MPGSLGQVSVTYHVPARLSVPGIGLTADSSVDVNYNNQAPLGLWLNLAVFTGLPVGDFLILTPPQTISGAPLWNGLAGSLGTPEIGLLNGEPSSARWFLEQNTPDMGPIPIAVYESGATAITQAAVPEPSTMALAAAAILILAWRMRIRVSARPESQRP